MANVIHTILINSSKYVNNDKYGIQILTWPSDEIDILHHATFKNSNDFVLINYLDNNDIKTLGKVRVSFFTNNKPYKVLTKKLGNPFYTRKLDNMIDLYPIED